MVENMVGFWREWVAVEEFGWEEYDLAQGEGKLRPRFEVLAVPPQTSV
jgi:hypothetical protein